MSQSSIEIEGVAHATLRIALDERNSYLTTAVHDDRFGAERLQMAPQRLRIAFVRNLDTSGPSTST